MAMSKVRKRANAVFNTANRLRREYLNEAKRLGANPCRKSLIADMHDLARREANRIVLSNINYWQRPERLG